MDAKAEKFETIDPSKPDWILQGPCFDYLVVGDIYHSGVWKRYGAVYDSFCEHLGVEKALADVLGHGLVIAQDRGLILGPDADPETSTSGECQWTYDYLTRGGQPAGVTLDWLVDTTADPSEAFYAQIARLSGLDISPTMSNDIGEETARWTDAQGAKAVLAEDYRGATVIVSTTATAVGDSVLDDMAKAALAEAARQE